MVLITIIVIGGALALTYKSNSKITENGKASVASAKLTPVDKNLTGSHDFDATTSIAHWTGIKTLLKNYADHGTINIKSGVAIFDQGKLIGGNVVFDMTSIATLSTGNGDDSKSTSMQAKHLKSADFFDADKYPDAKFTITNVEKIDDSNYNLTGDLIIKDKTNPISFHTIVTTKDGLVTMTGSTTLNRTLWDIRYGSKKFFSSIGDQVIDDMFILEFKVITK